ncbi:MAG: hypothetical protein KF799_10390 [Bdellovibrionales bacterium]|nr:hypothetical protein [Bdellovibrionales bacterium]
MWTVVFFLSLVASATSPDPSKPTIWVDGYTNAEIQNYFPANDYNYVSKTSQRRAQWEDDGYLPPLERDSLFRKLGIETKLQALDQMDKDMLVMGAREYTVPQLHKQYPMLSLGELRRLKREVEKIK